MNTAIKWMTEHPVAAWLSMIMLVGLGVLTATTLPQKTFPEFALDAVSISVSYPGASPSEIQDSIVRPIEDELGGVDGIDDITANISEGRGGVTVTFLDGEDIDAKLDEVKTEIDAIDVFPEDAEDPVVVRADNSTRVLEIALHGAASEQVLKEEARRLKNELTAIDGISFVEVANVRDYEISIEIDRDTLRAYGLTLGEVAQVVGLNSLELPGGSIETDSVSIPIRTLGRNYTRTDFENIVIRSSDTGAQVFLRDIATVNDGFEDSDLSSSFNGASSVSVNVFRVGDEQILRIVDLAEDHLRTQFRPSLEQGIEATIWQNEATQLQSRIDLLTKNAVIGLALVILCLALFLDIRLAFWSAVGIGVSFAATFIVMGALGMSINMISLFGFILAIGIVVDNAIVVSENIYKNGEDGVPPVQAAVKGTQRIAVPVIFSTLTTLVAFWPLLQMPAPLGSFLGDIPTVVMIVLSLSMLQALLILPRNLTNLDMGQDYRPNLVFRFIGSIRGFIDRGLKWFIRNPLDAMLRFCVNRIFIPIACVIAMMMLTIALISYGYVRFSFFPEIQGEFVTAAVEMTDGTTFDRTEAVAEDLRVAAIRAGDRLQDTLPDGAPPVVIGQYLVVGIGAGGGGPTGEATPISPTVAQVVVEITKATARDWESAAFERLWREEVGQIAGINTLTISSSLVEAGDAIAVELSLPGDADISPIVQDLRDSLGAIPGVFQILDDNSSGKLEYKLELKPEARLYGLTLQDLAVQTRNGFFGIEATSVQRGQDNVSVMVRFPSQDRDSLADLLDTRIATASGDLIPLSTVATLVEGLSPSEILRQNGRRVTTITADVDESIITNSEANRIIREDLLPPLLAEHPGLNASFGGEQETQNDAQAALSQALGIAMFVIFALLALVFRSFVQPIVVMLAIPLGLIGAVTGHLILGIPLGLLSFFGIIGLAGVVINNSLVMIDLYNEYLSNGYSVKDAVVEGTKDRFRPIFLTSVTTFLGVYPLIMETSLQAQFLIPLAVSIGYGVLIGTFVIIFAIPAVFILVHQVSSFVAKLASGFTATADKTKPKPDQPQRRDAIDDAEPVDASLKAAE
ncbi:efflux RND transporter permease subunit [Roseobacter sp. CCS2]|uniref:efflux RND transporter permease subunit n=1 Tax=Roseobacter sp. CCS2 TaxID=391593 RepID=UPI0000F3FDD4|nr:efflux RND transporter permease subunit [Roseobacter sp. CCS2]EBA10691.1 multidrug efflux transporter, AcrB/AcrD/AcrF family protein [Roseobacter sp. CCS2]